MSATNTTPKESWSPPPSFTSPRKRAPANPPSPTATNWSTSSSFSKATSTASDSSLRKWWIRTVRPGDSLLHASPLLSQFSVRSQRPPFHWHPPPLLEPQNRSCKRSTRQPFDVAYARSTPISDRLLDLSLRRLELMLPCAVVNEGHPLSALSPFQRAFQTDEPCYLAPLSSKSFRSNTYEATANHDSERLTEDLSPLEATLTKNGGEG